MTFRPLASCPAAALDLLLGVAAAAEDESPPDLTLNQGLDRRLTHNLGATGMRGWIHTKAANFFESVQGRTTTAPSRATPAGRGRWDTGACFSASTTCSRAARMFCRRSAPDADGRPNGPIPAYGPVNAAGLVGNLAIVLGRRCGIDDPEVEAAVERASRFAAYYVDKGSIPYGEHAPWPYVALPREQRQERYGGHALRGPAGPHRGGPVFRHHGHRLVQEP